MLNDIIETRMYMTLFYKHNWPVAHASNELDNPKTLRGADKRTMAWNFRLLTWSINKDNLFIYAKTTQGYGLCTWYSSPLLHFSSAKHLAASFSKSRANSRALSEIAQTGWCAYKNKECAHTVTCCACVLTSLSGGREMEYLGIV